MAKTKYTYKYNGVICRNSNNLYKYGLANENDVVVACSSTEQGALRDKTYNIKRCTENMNYYLKHNKPKEAEYYKQYVETFKKWHVVELEIIENKQEGCKMDKAVKRYNNLMYALGYDYHTIGTSDTDDPRINNWNLRDMISEVQYWLDFYQSDDCIYREEAYDTSYPNHKALYKQYRSDLAKMQRFIAAYEKEALAMVCYEGHCSKYD